MIEMCFNNVMVIDDKSKKTNILLEVTKNALGVTTVAALIIVVWATWLQIQATTHWQSGMEYTLLLAAPFIYSASAFLLVRGIILLARAVRRYNSGKVFRISLAAIGFVFLLPGGYLIYSLAAYYFVQYNAERISPKAEVLQLVKDCKVATVRRKYASWNKSADQRQSTAAAYLKDSAKSDLEKQTPFYGYRSFDPVYYDELAKTASSSGVEQKCGNVELYDEHREDIPTTYNWVNKEEAIESLQACKIQDIFTDAPSEGLLNLAADSKSSSANIFMVMDPVSEGFASKLYLNDTSQDVRSNVLDFAKTKKSHCRDKQPNIDGVE
jgi:hypothetical protein